MCPLLKTLQGSLHSQLKRFEGWGKITEVNPCKSLKSPVKRGTGTYLPLANLKKQMPRLAWRQESAWLSSVSSLEVEEKTGVWGPCWGKKAKNPPRRRKRNCELRELKQSQVTEV